jgi:hypothetical protein
MGLRDALAVVAAGGLALVVILLGVLALEARRHRRLAARRHAVDRELYRAAALAAMPSRLPSRSATGLGLVALGTLLVLLRDRGDRGDD